MSSYVEQCMGKCVHFRGVQTGRCAAGVEYAAVTVQHEAMPYTSHGRTYHSASSIPCLTKYNHAGAECAVREMPTREACEQREADWQREFAKTMGARALIVETTRGQRGVTGRVPCPACDGGTLSYSVAGNNGHIHARCSTAGCVAWME